MTPFERTQHAQALKAARENLRATLEGWAVFEHTQALEALETSARKVDQERAAIINAWDSQRLAADLAIYSARISNAAQAGNLAELQDVYTEAQSSGDKYKQRAAAVAIQSSAARLPGNAQDIHGNDGRMIVNRLQVQAARDLAQLKTSPQLETALTDLDAATQAMRRANSEIETTAEVLGDTVFNGSIHNMRLESALSRVRLHQDGSFEIMLPEEEHPTGGELTTQQKALMGLED
jgi:hypothetical protein